MSRRILLCLVALGEIWLAVPARAGSACVWKITASDGKIAYLGGSVHALRQSDYPLPAAFTKAFDASSRIALEVDARALEESSRALVHEGKYKHGDSLKKHVDPRTYAYMRKLFQLMNVSEETLAQCKPWYIVLMLQSVSTRRSLPEAGVDDFFMRRAAKRKVPIVGLESVEEHARVYSGLSDRESEILLLVTFIPSAASGTKDDMLKAWRRGDAEALATIMQRDSAEFPAFNERLLGARNRAWVPKIENYLESGNTYFVLVGAGHFGGSNGLLALLRAKGYQIEQL